AARDHEGRAAPPDTRRRAPRDAELRQEVARRDQGAARGSRPDRGAGPRRVRHPERRARRRGRGRDRDEPQRWRGARGNLVPHKVHERKFGRRTGHRRSMLRNLSLSVLRYERVKTTEAKAKEVRVFVDQMINLGKDGSLAARRRALAWLPEPVIVDKVFTDLATRYPDRRSGYLRSVRPGHRVGASAPPMLLD